MGFRFICYKSLCDFERFLWNLKIICDFEGLIWDLARAELFVLFSIH